MEAEIINEKQRADLEELFVVRMASDAALKRLVKKERE